MSVVQMKNAIFANISNALAVSLNLKQQIGLKLSKKRKTIEKRKKIIFPNAVMSSAWSAVKFHAQYARI
jgi:hypothetical protein